MITFLTVLVIQQLALAVMTSSDNVTISTHRLIRINMMGLYFNSFAFLFCFRISVSAESRVADEQASTWKRNNIYEGIALRAYFCRFLWLWMFWNKTFKAGLAGYPKNSPNTQLASDWPLMLKCGWNNVSCCFSCCWNNDETTFNARCCKKITKYL